MSQSDALKLNVIEKARLVIADGDFPEGADLESPEYRDRVERILEITKHPDRPAETQVIYERGR